MKREDYTYSFNSSKTPEEVFQLLLDVEQWWSGLYGETIQGKTDKLNDEFIFNAGGGAHYSKQKLTEIIPNKKVVWLVTDSKLNFLTDTGEWIDTKISFDISTKENTTKITFNHHGLVPQIECYDSCSGAWTNYLQKLEQKLN